MPKGLRRIHGGGDWHFIIGPAIDASSSSFTRRKDLFLKILQQEVRVKDNVIIGGYVAMPEHFHLLVSDPPSERKTVSERKTGKVGYPENAAAMQARIAVITEAEERSLASCARISA